MTTNGLTSLAYKAFNIRWAWSSPTEAGLGRGQQLLPALVDSGTHASSYKTEKTDFLWESVVCRTPCPKCEEFKHEY